MQKLPSISSKHKSKEPLMHPASIPFTPSSKAPSYFKSSLSKPSKLSYLTKSVSKNPDQTTSKYKNLKLFEELLSKYNERLTPKSNNNFENIRNVTHHMKRLRKSLDIYNLSPTSPKLSIDFQHLKPFLHPNPIINFSSKPRIWRFSSKGIPKSTQKLIDSISQQHSPK